MDSELGVWVLLVGEAREPTACAIFTAVVVSPGGACHESHQVCKISESCDPCL